MGVVFGRFEPTDDYSLIQNECRANHRDQTSLALSVQTETGQLIQCAGVGILDYSEELLPDLIEINVLGIPQPLYREFFPEQVARYSQHFS